MALRMDQKFAPEGLTRGFAEARRMDAARTATMSRLDQENDRSAAHDDDRYDDGLVHEHHWAKSSSGRH